LSKYSNSYSIIIPVYNEEDIILRSIDQNISVLDNAEVDYELIIVNDGSKDSSGELINQFLINKRVQVFHHSDNVGFGGAVKTGINLARNTLILCVPADSPLTEPIFKDFMAVAPKADVIVSYRIARLGYTPRMRLNSYVYHLLIEFLFDIHFVDFNWIHLYNRNIFDEGKIEITSKGIFMLAEVLIQADRKGYNFIEIPVAQNERITGIATASKFSIIFKTLYEIARYYIK
jgi:glycosyltransferase involved in cell wall biosynthesis